MPQLPPESVAESRSTICVLESMPAPASEPFESVSGTEAVVYHGPPESAADAPVGAVESGVSVNALGYDPIPPAAFVAVTVCAPEALADEFHV